MSPFGGRPYVRISIQCSNPAAGGGKMQGLDEPPAAITCWDVVVPLFDAGGRLCPPASTRGSPPLPRRDQSTCASADLAAPTSLRCGRNDRDERAFFGEPARAV